MTDDARQEVEALAKRYYHAMLNGDGALVREVFDADARFQGFRGGEPVRRNLDAFVALVESEDTTERIYELAVDLIDITGDIGVVRVTDRYRGRLYTDYLTVMKVAGSWRIVNKTFTG